MPFLPPNQQCQSTEGTASEVHCYIQTSQKPSNSLSSVTKHGAIEIFKNWSELILEQPITRSVGSGQPFYCSNCRRLCTENVQYIHLTAAYLTTVCQVIIKICYLCMKQLTHETLKMLIFTINCRPSQHVYITINNSRVARSVWKFPPNCFQFNMPAEFTLGY